MKLQKPPSFSYQNISIFIIPIFLLIVIRVLGFDGLYGQDSYEYLRYSKAITHYIKEGVHPGGYYWPVLYSFFGSLFSFLVSSEHVALMLITVISNSVTFLYILKTIQILYPGSHYSWGYTIIFGILSPFFLKISLVVMSDVTASMFITLSFYFLIKTLNYKKSPLYPMFLFATCAIMTRYPSLIITVPIIVYAILIAIKRKAIKDFLIASLLSFLVCIPFAVLQSNNLSSASSNYFFNSWSIMNYFRSSYATVDGLQSYPFVNVVHTLSIFIHPGFIFIGFFLILLLLKKYKKFVNSLSQKLILIAILLYVLFLSGIPFQNPRILALAYPLVLLLFYPVFSELMHISFIKKYNLHLAVVCIFIQLGLWVFTFQHPYKRALFEKEIAESLTPYQGKKLYSFDIDIALQGRGLDFEYKSMFAQRYDYFETGDLVLFHPTKFLKQWKNKNPMINWNTLQKSYTLKLLKPCSEGWNLYQISPNK